MERRVCVGFQVEETVVLSLVNSLMLSNLAFKKLGPFVYLTQEYCVSKLIVQKFLVQSTGAAAVKCYHYN